MMDDGQALADAPAHRSVLVAAPTNARPLVPARPLVSVIIPAWNAAGFIGETLASAQAQTWPNLEIIVVDDGSTDDTAAIVEAAAATDPRITLIRQANAGVAAARNRAITAAKGEFVAPLDADDIWHPENVEAQVEALERAGPGVALAYAWSVDIDKSGVVLAFRSRTIVESQGAIRRAFIGRNFIGNGSACVIRRACMLSVGGYDTRTAIEGVEDLALALTLSERWNFAAARRVLIGYRQHEESLSHRVAKITSAYDLLLKEFEAKSPDLGSAIFAERMGSWYAGRLGRSLIARDLAATLSVLEMVRIRGRHCLAPFVWHCGRHFIAIVARYLRGVPKVSELGSFRQIMLPNDWQMIEPKRQASKDAPEHGVRLAIGSSLQSAPALEHGSLDAPASGYARLHAGGQS